MHQRITQDHFVDAFRSSETYKNNFTIPALHALFEYLNDLEDESVVPLEFDMIATCCEYSEFESIADYNSQYSQEFTNRNEVDELTCNVGEQGFICHEH
ncbi:MAG: hypothetical protein COC24_004550 [Alphaproteobacteria bacterium]|nr:hypothetical protein [Alphaproteobacteria bacterium]